MKTLGYVFFDLEATSSHPEEAQIIQIAAYIEGKDPFHAFVQAEGLGPDAEVWRLVPFSYEQWLRDAKPPREVFQTFLDYVGDRPWAGHNVLSYDLPLLKRVFQEYQLDFPKVRVLDTQRFAQLIFPSPPKDGSFRGYSLSDLYFYFKKQEPPAPHDALSDVRTNLYIAKKLVASAKDQLSSEMLVLWSALELEEARALGHSSSEVANAAHALTKVLGRDAEIPWIYSEGKPFPKAWDDPDQNLELLGEIREPQLQMMLEVASTLGRVGEASLIEAPTGTGKTRGYLFPALWAASSKSELKTPYIVATHTKLLQEQAIEDLERVATKGYQVSVVNLKSPRDYLCLDALKEAFEEREHLSDDARACIASLLHFASKGGYDFESLPAYWRSRSGFREILYRVQTNPRRCGQGPEHRHCAYTIVLERKKQAKIWITNQAWLLAHFGTEGSATAGEDEESGTCCQLVIDEAHNLEGQATASFSRVISGEELVYRIRRLYDPGRRTGLFRDRSRLTELFKDDPPQKLLEFASEFRQQMALEVLDGLRRLGDLLKKFIKQYGRGDPRYEIRLDLVPGIQAKREWPRIEKEFDGLMSVLRQLRKRLRDVVPRYSRLDYRLDPLYDALDRSLELAQMLKAAASGRLDEREWVLELVYSDADGTWSLVAQPVDLTHHLSNLWRRTNGLVLTSATLSLGEDFSYIRRFLGLDKHLKVRTQILEGTLPYHRAHLFVPSHLPEARASLQKRFLRLLEEELTALLPRAHRSLTIFTSSERLKEIGVRVKDRVGNIYLPLTRKEREDVLRRMRGDPLASGHAFGSRAFMEGADLPNLKLVNLERIPFPVPNRLLEARGELAKAQDLDPWENVYLPQAVLSFVQAFGRLIRDDRKEAGDGAFVLWDKRLVNAFYQTRFFDALPKGVKLHFPKTRVELYDELAPVLGIDRELLPSEELNDYALKRLRAIREESGTWLEKAARLAHEFWDGIDLLKDAERESKQRKAIEADFGGRSLFVFLPTGYGKSLTFQLPAFIQGGLTVVVSPLKALMADQVRKLQDRGLPAAKVDSSMVAAERSAVYEEVRRGRVNLLYLSPERLVRDQEVRRLLLEARDEEKLRRVVFDEAHSVWEWGHDFRPHYLRSVEAIRDLAPRVPISALTATATPELREALFEVFEVNDSSVDVIEANPDRPEIWYGVKSLRGQDAPIKKLAELMQLLQFLDHREKDGWTAIVYVQTRKMAERLAWALGRLGLRAEAYHAGLSDLIRSEVQLRFEEGETPVVVATKAFGMGIDKANVRAVVHFEPPESLEAYLQESGRAGRDGREAYAFLTHASADWKLLEFMASRWDYDESHVDALWSVLERNRGRFWGYGENLLKEVNELANLGREEGDYSEIGLHQLEIILERASRFGVLDYDYYPGKVAVLSEACEFPEVPPEILERRGDRCEFDLGRLPTPVDAEDLGKRLYEKWRTGELKLVRFYQPAIHVELKNFEQKIALRNWTKKNVKRAKDRVSKVRAYTQSGGCLREYLVHYQGYELKVCSGCSYHDGDPPWYIAAHELPLEAIQNAYRPEEVLLDLLDWMEKTWNGWGLNQPFRGYGTAVIIHTLLGERHFWAGKDHKRIPDWLYRSRFFGLLAFVKPKELSKLLNELVARGFASEGNYYGHTTYRISAAGRDRLVSLQRRRVKEAGSGLSGQHSGMD